MDTFYSALFTPYPAHLGHHRLDLILAGLAAQKKTIVNRVYHLDRGYDAIEKKFARLNAAIKRVK